MPEPLPSVAQVYRQTLKSKDIFFNVYVCRPVAAVFVRGLLATRVTPNQVTLFSFGLASLACGVLLLVPWPLGLWVGVALFECSYVFDKVDGMLARARGTASVSGQLLDFLMDEIKALLLLAAVGVGGYRATGQLDYLWLALGGLVALAAGLSITTFQRRPELATPTCSDSRQPQEQGLARRGLAVAESMGRFGIHYPSYLWLAAALTDVRIYLFPYVAVNLAYFAKSLLSLLWRYGKAAA